jgi:A/G-specific adenine glycosylase
VNWQVVLCAGRVLLQRRPARGIWGGLWSFPESARAPAGRLLRHRALPDLEHAFTHFTLRARPALWRVRAPAPAAAPGTAWMSVAVAGRAALPAPVRDLLRRIARDEALEPG